MALGKEPLPEKTVVKKPALSLLAIFFPYIIDLVIATIVCIVLLLAAFGFYTWSNNLNMPRFLFVLRFFELLIVSFGTFLCAVHFLNSIGSAIKLKRQLQKQTKEFGDELPGLHPRDIARRFGQPWREHRVSLIVCSLVVLGFLYVGVSFAEIVRDDCDDASILACEMLCETGPYFPEPVDNHAIMLKNYAKYMENKHLAGLLRIFSSYRPEKVFTATSETLSNAKGSQEEVANEIWRAGEDVMLFRLKAPKLLPRGIVLHEYRKAPGWLLSDAAVALEESENASKLFINTRTMENAVHSCERNRKTMLLLFLARASYNRPEIASLFTRFRAVVEECRKSKIDVASVLPDADPWKEFLEKIIAVSEQRRSEILDDIKNRNTQEAIERMWDAIEISYSKRTELLELCAKIRSAGNYSEEITS